MTPSIGNTVKSGSDPLIPGAFATSPPQTASRTTAEKLPEKKEDSAQIPREASEAPPQPQQPTKPYGAHPSRPTVQYGAQQHLQQPIKTENDCSDDESSSGDDDSDDHPATASSAHFGTAISPDIPIYSKQAIKHVYKSKERASAEASRVKKLIGLSTYRQWKDSICPILAGEGLMGLLDGRTQKPPRGHKLRLMWDSINIHASRVLLATISDIINQSLGCYYMDPRYIWDELNYMYSPPTAEEEDRLKHIFNTSQNGIQTSCEHCGKSGHNVDQCWKKHPQLAPRRLRGRRGGAARSRQQPQAQARETNDNTVVETGSTFVNFDLVTKITDLSTDTTPNILRWMAATACSDHIVTSTDYFVPGTTKTVQKTIRTDLTDYDVDCIIGDIEMILDNSTRAGLNMRLQDVVYVPDVPFNVVSIPKLAKRGYETCFKRTGFTLYKNGRTSATGTIKGRHFLLGVREVIPSTRKGADDLKGASD